MVLGEERIFVGSSGIKSIFSWGLGESNHQPLKYSFLLLTIGIVTYV